jgi:hypothetical protein
VALPDPKSTEPQSVRIARLMGLAGADNMSDAVLAKNVAKGIPVAAPGAVVLPGRGSVGIGSVIHRMSSGQFLRKENDDLEGWLVRGGKIIAIGGRVTLIPTTVPASLADETKGGLEILTRQESERLYEVSRVFDAALRAFNGNAEKAEGFLNRAHPLLDGEVPLELAQVSSAGADAVVNLIGRAVAGVAI